MDAKYHTGEMLTDKYGFTGRVRGRELYEGEWHYDIGGNEAYPESDYERPLTAMEISRLRGMLPL
jgi:hypothetical protein